jgi:hypothetical protein
MMLWWISPNAVEFGDNWNHMWGVKFGAHYLHHVGHNLWDRGAPMPIILCITLLKTVESNLFPFEGVCFEEDSDLGGTN